MLQKPVAAASLALHLALLLYLTLVYHTEHRVSTAGALNLVPLRSIWHFFRTGGWYMIVNVAGNIVAFAPLGLLLPVLLGARSTPMVVALTGMVLSLSIESAQYLSGRRVADLDDVILNTLGTLLGFAVWSLLAHWRTRARGRPARGAIG
jgi:glycopeptide antibiotics resistance protein